MSSQDYRDKRRRKVLLVEVDATLMKVCKQIAEKNGETLARVVRRGLLAYAQAHTDLEVLPTHLRGIDRYKVKDDVDAKALHAWAKRHGQKELLG